MNNTKSTHWIWKTLERIVLKLQTKQMETEWYTINVLETIVLHYQYQKPPSPFIFPFTSIFQIVCPEEDSEPSSSKIWRILFFWRVHSKNYETLMSLSLLVHPLMVDFASYTASAMAGAQRSLARGKKRTACDFNYTTYSNSLDV